MNRRKAIQNIAIAGASAVFYPGCKVEDFPKYDRIPMTGRQWRVFQQFAEGILPTDYDLFPAPESRSEFILNIMNACATDESVSAYNEGLKEFVKKINDMGIKSLMDLDENTLDTFYKELEQTKRDNPNLGDFFQNTRDLAIQHFTTSEKYMTEQLDFEFVPGHYHGCIDV